MRKLDGKPSAKEHGRRLSWLCGMHHLLPTSIISLLFMALSNLPARAELVSPRLVARLVPSSSEQVTRFASHLDVDGNRILVGAAQGGFLFSGPASLDEPWIQEQFLDTPLGPRGSSFGAPVALWGDVALFGASGANTAAQQAGGADFFRRFIPSGPYVTSQTVWPADSEIHDQFGRDVALGEGIGFVGADNDNHNGKQSTGTVTLFRQLDGNSGVFAEIKKFAPDDLNPGHDFGGRLALDGDRLIVAASGNGANPGAAYIYERNAGGPDNWGQAAKLQSPGQRFGQDVSLSGNTVVVSTTGRFAAAGSVYVYDRDPMDGAWAVTTLLKAPENQGGDGFGEVVAINGDLAVVGAVNGTAIAEGAAYVYRRDEGGENNWGLIAELKSPDPTAVSYFGSSVEIMDNLVFVGSLGFGSNPLGTVYVYVIPEPSTVALLLSAIIWLFCCRRSSG